MVSGWDSVRPHGRHEFNLYLSSGQKEKRKKNNNLELDIMKTHQLLKIYKINPKLTYLARQLKAIKRPEGREYMYMSSQLILCGGKTNTTLPCDSMPVKLI